MKDNRTYTGSTNDLKRRLREHNNGHVTATVNRAPLKIIYAEEYKNEIDARKKEKWFKTRQLAGVEKSKKFTTTRRRSSVG